MFNEIMSLMVQAYSSVASWHTQVLNASGMRALTLSMVVIFLGVKYLLGPLLFRDASSDTASPVNNDL